MAITKKDADYVARLARLSLSDKEKETYAGQLEAILGHIEQLKKLDTADVAPTSHVLPLVNVWREDKLVRSSDELRERILSNAPARDDDYYKVKKIIE